MSIIQHYIITIRVVGRAVSAIFFLTDKNVLSKFDFSLPLSGTRDIAEISLRLASNTNQSINQSINIQDKIKNK